MKGFAKNATGRWVLDPPAMLAYALPDGQQWVLWCDRCHCWHYHGPGPGHRVAHCPMDVGYQRGYVLVGGDPAPRWVLDDIKRDRPKGPALTSQADPC